MNFDDFGDAPAKPKAKKAEKKDDDLTFGSGFDFGDSDDKKKDDKSKDVPLIVLVLIKSLLGDMADGKMNSLKMIMDQINKKPDEVITTERKPLHEIFNFTDNKDDKDK